MHGSQSHDGRMHPCSNFNRLSSRSQKLRRLSCDADVWRVSVREAAVWESAQASTAAKPTKNRNHRQAHDHRVERHRIFPLCRSGDLSRMCASCGLTRIKMHCDFAALFRIRR
jgi:hypothetical protein